MKKQTFDFEVQLSKSQNRQMTKSNFVQRLWLPHSVTINMTVTVIQFLLWFQQVNCWMLKNVSRHYIALVLEICLIFFHVFLNNEKLPFVLELSSNNQMYYKRYLQCSPKQTKNHFSSILTWYSCFCATGSHPLLLKVTVRSVNLFTVHDPLSYKWR